MFGVRLFVGGDAGRGVSRRGFLFDLEVFEDELPILVEVAGKLGRFWRYE